MVAIFERLQVSPKEISPKALRLQGMTSIEALDDACLTRIFAFLSPLPDLFNVSRVCQVQGWRHRKLSLLGSKHTCHIDTGSLTRLCRRSASTL